MNTFGFIGMGNMGNAMLNGLLKEVPAHAVRFTEMLTSMCRSLTYQKQMQ